MEYGLAVNLLRKGEPVEANAAVARGIVLKREHGVQKRSWFLADRFQGPDPHPRQVLHLQSICESGMLEECPHGQCDRQQ